MSLYRCTVFAAAMLLVLPLHAQQVGWGTTITDEQQQVLDAHNNERKSLGISPLTWDAKLAAYAQQRADLLARNNDTSLTHPLDRGASSNSFKPGEPIGENLHYSSNWSSSGPGTIAPLSEAVLGAKGRPGLNDIEGWLDEKPWYHYDNNTCDPGRNCGHYTQMVWKATQLVGCAKQTTLGNNGYLYTYIACEYYPAGNTGGKPYTDCVGNASSCGAPKVADGGQCATYDQCANWHGPGVAGSACDGGRCVPMKKDWAGVYFPPSECTGSPGGKAGSC